MPIFTICILLLIVMPLTVIFAILMTKKMIFLINHTKLSQAVAGVVILSIITSLPEIIAAIWSIFQKTPHTTVANILGCNQITIITLSGMHLIFFWKKKHAEKIDKQNLMLLIMLIGIDCLLFLSLLIKDLRAKIPKTEIWWGNILIVIFIIVNFSVAIYHQKQNSQQKINSDFVVETTNQPVIKYKDKQIATILFILYACALIAISSGLSFLIDNFDKNNIFGKKHKFVGGLLLSIVTSTPEIVAAFHIIKAKIFNVAVGTITGTAVFNLILITINDLSSKPWHHDNNFDESESWFFLIPLITMCINLFFLLQINITNKFIKSRGAV